MGGKESAENDFKGGGKADSNPAPFKKEKGGKEIFVPHPYPTEKGKKIKVLSGEKERLRRYLNEKREERGEIRHSSQMSERKRRRERGTLTYRHRLEKKKRENRRSL